jgi:uncharacterized repeat protein (TIGR03987 family)
MLWLAVLLMNLALVFYTWAVLGARRQGLRRRHLALFGIGLLCDYLGTHQMNLYGITYGYVPEWHTLAGLASLAGMGLHFLLASAALLFSRGGSVNRFFHRVSLGIYTFWLIAFLSGASAALWR